MNLSDFWQNLWREQTALIWTAGGFLILFAILTVVSIFDSTQILGVNRWIKPMKFASSAAIFLLTLAVYLFYLDGAEKSKSVIAWGAILIMFGEVFLITMQAARGTTSHFNTADAFDALVFSAMAFLIAVNTFLVLFLTFLYFQANFTLPNSVVWGMRLGLIVFLLGSLQGGFMASQTGHTIGAADGGAGLPFVHWSVTHGDLRVAHFLGLHALQILPAAALLFVWLHERIPKFNPTMLTFAFALFYFAAFNFLFIQAMRGQPLLKIESAKTDILRREL